MSSRGDVTLEDGRSLSSLRVVDLKEELEKRSLSKSGSKKDLVDRLKKHVLIEKQREDAGRSDGLPNISMQDKLAEQNPFIREYFESQAQEFHSQTVVKELYQVEKERGLDHVEVTEEQPPPPVPVVENMVTLDPVPQEEESKEPPAPTTETKGHRSRRRGESSRDKEEEPPAPAVEKMVDVPVPLGVKLKEPPAVETKVIRPETQVIARKSSVKELEPEPIAPPKLIYTDEKELNKISQETIKPSVDEQPPRRRRRFDVMPEELPAAAPAVEKMVTLDPIPQEEEPKERPAPTTETKGHRSRRREEPPAPAEEKMVTLDVPVPQGVKLKEPPPVETKVTRPETQVFATKSSVKELEPESFAPPKPIHTDEKELNKIPQDTIKPAVNEQPPRRRRRFDVMPEELPAAAPAVEKMVTLDPVPQEEEPKEPPAPTTEIKGHRSRRREEPPGDKEDEPPAPAVEKIVTVDPVPKEEEPKGLPAPTTETKGHRSRRHEEPPAVEKMVTLDPVPQEEPKGPPAPTTETKGHRSRRHEEPPAAAVEKMVTLDPVPKEQPKEPPAPTTETKGHRSRRREEPPVPAVEKMLTLDPVPQEEEPKGPPAPTTETKGHRSRRREEPPAPAVEKIVTRDPVPQEEEPKEPSARTAETKGHRSRRHEEPPAPPVEKLVTRDPVPQEEEPKGTAPTAETRGHRSRRREEPPAAAVKKMVTLDSVPPEEEPKGPPVPTRETKGHRSRRHEEPPAVEKMVDIPAPEGAKLKEPPAVETKVMRPKTQVFATKISVKEHEPEPFPPPKPIHTDEKELPALAEERRRQENVLKDRKRRFEEPPGIKEEEHPVPVRRTSQEQKVEIKRKISIRSNEGIDEDALDYGDEDKDRKEPQKFIWTPRILRLNSNFNSNKSEETEATSPTWSKKEKTEGAESDDHNHHNTYVSSGVLVTFFPEADLISESELKLESEKSPSRSEGSSLQIITRTITNETEEGEGEGEEEMEMGVNDDEGQVQGPSHSVEDNNGDLDMESKDDLRNKVEISLKRKISINPMPSEEVEKELTPPRHSLSNVIIVTNLVRPFTVIQLRELLQRTGNITEFWVDKIKSKCVAKFEKEDEAYETRAALHGVRWPTSNPKTLQVDFTTEERLENLKERESRNDVQTKVEEKPQKAHILPVREWDLGKRERGGRSRSPSGLQRRRSSKSPTPPDRKKARRGSPDGSRVRRASRSPQRDRRGRDGETKKEPEPSGKALDELFRKTVAVPCIYWLPLTPQQISEKEELRRKRMIERERRISELAKLRSR